MSPPIKMPHVPAASNPPVSGPQQPIPVPPLASGKKPENSEQEGQNQRLIACAVLVAIAIFGLLLAAFIGCPATGIGNGGNGGRGGNANEGSGRSTGESPFGKSKEQNSIDGQDRLAQEAAEQAEQDRLAQEAAEQAEQERLAQEAAEQAEQERLAQEAAEQTEPKVLSPDATAEIPQEMLDVDFSDGMNLQKGGKTSVSVFGGKGSGNRFTFIFDRSGSMLGAPLEASKRELIAAIKSLKSHNEFSIVFFDSTPEMYRPGMQKATLQNINNAIRYIEGISIQGGTEHLPALQMGIALKPDCIFFLTDGAFLGDEKEQLAKIKQNAQRIQINVIELGMAPQALPDNFLKQLAKQNNGDYVYVYVK